MRKPNRIESPYMDILQVRDMACMIYSTPVLPTFKRKHFKNYWQLLKNKKKAYSGKITAGARKRISMACTLLCQSAETKRIYNPVSKKNFYHKLSFITLTMSDSENRIDAAEAYKKLLHPFIKWLQEIHGMKSYLWKAEHQKNGQLHYHITTPIFISWQLIRQKWNYLQNKIGMLDSFYAKFNHYNPNSTDIHTVKNVKNLSSYLLKEICKSYQNENSVNGKVWGCSDNLSGKKYFSVEMNDWHAQLITMAEEEKLATVVKGDRFTLVKFKEAIDKFILSDEERADYEKYILEIREGKLSQLKK